MRFSDCSDVGQVRRINQDSLCREVLDEAAEIALVAVADGMGGYQAGEVASQLAIARVRTEVVGHWREWGSADRVLDGLRAAVETANAAILAAQADPEQAGMGTTLTAALVEGDTIFLAHAGDSRGYLVKPEDVRQITDDHSVVGELVRSGSLTEAEAMNHPQRHLLTSALGSPAGIQVDAVAVGWAPGDTLVLCTDGLTNLVNRDEVAQAILRSEPFEAVAPALVALANARGGPDNITVVACRRDGVAP